jgi:hypothetical protein
VVKGIVIGFILAHTEAYRAGRSVMTSGSRGTHQS